MSPVEDIMGIVRTLSEEAQTEVLDFARFLSRSRKKPKRTKLAVRDRYLPAFQELRAWLKEHVGE